ncbi:unnamed protein product [Cladocopium goreaui]|uniref:Uncharacterized protein n=1 Tax=Cladocopium goreaui TaxID=2562237 RepID=A0A9P1FCF6_9DINO|nr:unnamed protein product [Cladocopium goreaui]
MEGSRFRQLICVGAAYFIIAVIVPTLWIHFRGDAGIIAGILMVSLGAFLVLSLATKYNKPHKPAHAEATAKVEAPAEETPEEPEAPQESSLE